MDNLSVIARFDRATYDIGEPVAASITVANQAGVATHVQLRVTGNVSWGSWGDLEAPDLRLEAGQSVTASSAGTVNDPEHQTGILLHVEVTADQEELNPFDNSFSSTAWLVTTRGNISGVLYVDLNANGAVDPAEGLGGMTVVATGGSEPFPTFDQTTDDRGRFTFQGIPAGDYGIYTRSSAWSTPVVYVSVDGVHDPDVVVRTAPTVDWNLSVTLRFQKAAYVPGETAHLTVTFFNSAPVPISGITLQDSNGFYRPGPHWGDLASGGTGVTIPAGSLRSYDVSFVVPPEARGIGYMNVSCTFGLAGPFGNVSATAFTRVTGGFARVRGTAIAVATMGGHWRFDSPLPYAEVHLSDVFPGGFAAATTAGASGQFEFTHVPAGLYDFSVAGFYHFADNRYPVYADTIASVAVYVVAFSGPAPTPPSSPSPAPQPAVVPARVDSGGGAGTDTGSLASTGSDVAWLAITGLLSLITGVLLLLRRGRRTTVR